MMSAEELHSRVLAFLQEEFKRTGAYACTRLDMLYSKGNGWRDEELTSWIRTDTPEIFDTLAMTEKLATTIIERAYQHADSYNEPGNYRYVLRTVQHLNGRSTWQFSVRPSGALAVNEEQQGAGQQLAGGPRQPVDAVVHALNITSRNQREMFQGTVSALINTNKSLLDENQDLKKRVRELEKSVDEAQSTRMEREWAIAQQVRKADRTDQGFQKLLHMGTLVASKLMASGDTSDGTAGAGLAMLIAQFGHSLRPDQIQALINLLDMPQKAMFQEIMGMAQAEAEKAQAAAAQGKKQ